MKRFFVGDDEDPWKCYNYAKSLVESRAHSEGGFMPKTSSIWPLIEHINGLPKCDHVNIKNSETDSQFILSAARDVKAGEELYLNHGWKEASHFVMGYGILPRIVCQDQTYLRDYVHVELTDELRIDETDHLRSRAVAICKCEPFKESYFLFPPSALSEWENEPKVFPRFLRDMMVYLQIKSATERDLHSDAFLEKINTDDKSGDLPSLLPKILEVFDRNESIVAPLTAEELEDDNVDERELTGPTLRRLSRTSFLEWRQRIVSESQEAQSKKVGLISVLVSKVVGLHYD